MGGLSFVGFAFLLQKAEVTMRRQCGLTNALLSKDFTTVLEPSRL